MRNVIKPRFTTEEFTEWFMGLLTHAIALRQSQNIVRDDYMNFLIELKARKNVSNDVLLSHAYTFFFDGFMTTSPFLSATINNLSIHARCQDTVRAETKSFAELNYDNLQEMTYLESFINGNFPHRFHL